MNVSTILKELNLNLFTYEEKTHIFHNNALTNYKRDFEFTSEFIKLVRYLKENHIKYREFKNGDVLVIS